MTDKPLSPDELEAALRRIGKERYHDLHPFHKLLHAGRLTRVIEAWQCAKLHHSEATSASASPTTAA